jgi:predicted nucleotidyltransferase
MDQAEAIATARKYLKKISPFVPFESAWLFGSYAGKQQRKDSDIDVGIVIKSLETDYLSTMKKLYQIRRQVDVRIEPHLLVRDKDPLEFADEVTKTGIRLS